MDRSASQEDLSDPELIRASSRGDAGAFRALFNRHVDRVHGYVLQRVGPQNVDDVVSETFAEAWRCADRFEPARGSASAWLFGIATMTVRHNRHKELRWIAALDRASLVRDVSTGEIEVGNDPQLLMALSRLGSNDRDLLMLVALADMAIGEAGKALGMSATAARIRLHRARKQLQQDLAIDGKA